MRDLQHPLAWLFAIALAVPIVDKVAAQESTTATYNDWVLQCQTEVGAPQQKICDIAQVTQMQGRNVPVSRVAIQHQVKGQSVKLVVQLPVNVSLRTNVRIQSSDSDPGLEAPFDRCVSAGCFANFDLKEDIIRKFRAGTEVGKITFKNANGQDIAIPLSFKGFGPAFDALAKE